MKFKVGDKVKFVRNRESVSNNRNHLLGKTFTIKRKSNTLFVVGWIMKEPETIDTDGGVFFFTEDELELVEDTKVDITIDVTDKAGAHKAVENAIAEYKKKKAEWTEDELAQAEKLYKDYLAEFVDRGHIPEFEVFKVLNVKEVQLYVLKKATFSLPWITCEYDTEKLCIGKVVCLCKALDKPIPDFIKNKNR